MKVLQDQGNRPEERSGRHREERPGPAERVGEPATEAGRPAGGDGLGQTALDISQLSANEPILAGVCPEARVDYRERQHGDELQLKADVDDRACIPGEKEKRGPAECVERTGTPRASGRQERETEEEHGAKNGRVCPRQHGERGQEEEPETQSQLRRERHAQNNEHHEAEVESTDREKVIRACVQESVSQSGGE